MADVLVGASVARHDSHGVVHLLGYLEEAASGHLVIDARPAVLRESARSALLDARGGWGAYGVITSMDLAVGVGVASLANSRHIVRLGYYMERAATQGLIAMVSFGGGGPGRHLAALFRGSERAFSTNPIAIGVPTGDDAALVLDYPTTGIANATAWVLRDAWEPGHLRLSQGHALSLLTCFLGGLSGAYDVRVQSREGPFFLPIDIGAFQPRGLAEYKRGERALLVGMRSVTPAPGFEGVLVPADQECRPRQEREVAGILLQRSVRIGLADRARKFGVSLVSEITTI